MQADCFIPYFPPATNNPFLLVLYLSTEGHTKRQNAPLMLDAFCGAGGAAWGYWLAGYNVVGVDINPQPNYPFPFIQGDAVAFIREHGWEFDFIHASPVCKRYTTITKTAGTQDLHPDGIEPVRDALKSTRRHYVIENVPGAPLCNALMLCGTMFGLNVLRHRLFETQPEIYFAPATCAHVKRVVKHGRKPDRNIHYAAITGHFSDIEFGRQAMGIYWMNGDELSQSIPPAFTEWLGLQLLPFLETAKH